MLVEPLDAVMHENVMPWMLDKMINFLEDETFIDYNVGEVVIDGFESVKNKHKDAIMREHQRRQDEIEAEKQRLIDKEIFRENRRK